MQLVNYSAEPEGKLQSWLPHGLRAEKIVFFPDACPGRSTLPTGTVVLLSQENWRKFAISDCGCGMRLLRSGLRSADLTQSKWDEAANLLKSNKGGLGDLGGGNHFLDAIEPYSGEGLHFLIHTGSRSESGLVDDLVDHPEDFDRKFARIVQWAQDNRAGVQQVLERVFGPMDLVLDLPHNTYEQLPGGRVIIRKGAVRVEPRDLCVIPSHMAGDVVLVRALEAVGNALNSLSHGTGRSVARSASKDQAASYDFDMLRRSVRMPSFLDTASLRTEGPYAYRDLDKCLGLLDGLVETVERFSVVGYMGHL
jgi:RNA-splicing ligase RtcB